MDDCYNSIEIWRKQKENKIYCYSYFYYLVCDLADREAGLVEDGDDALVLLLYQVADDAVVEVLDGSPLDPLSLVLLLFLFQHQLDE